MNLFNQDSNKKTSKVTDVVKVPNYGAQKIDEAKGNFKTIKNSFLGRLLRADQTADQPNDHCDQNRDGPRWKQAPHLRREIETRTRKPDPERSDNLPQEERRDRLELVRVRRKGRLQRARPRHKEASVGVPADHSREGKVEGAVWGGH